MDAVRAVVEAPLPAGPTPVPAGDLTVDATWGPDGSPYVIDGRLRVRAGATLTILPGTIVKFVPHDEKLVNDGQLLIYGGQLVAQGSGASPIVFTSYYDDSAGGDTDGGGRQPERGDWYNLSFTAASPQEAAAMPASVLENVSVRYGGEGAGENCLTGSAVDFSGFGKLQVSRSEFVESRNAGIRGPDLEPGAFFSVMHSRFADSGCGVNVRGGDVFNNIFEASLLSRSMRSGSSDAENVRVIGNWMYKVAEFAGGDREQLNALGNAFIDGVVNHAQDQDHDDLRFNHWGGPRAMPGNCVNGSVTYVPAVDYGDVICPLPGSRWVEKYFTLVLPMIGPPPVPEVGPGATITPPGGLPIGGLSLGQTFGFECDCLDPPTEQQHLTARPVNTATGSLVEFFTDISLPGRGVPFKWSRTYNSLDITDGPMGPGWTFGYNASVEPSGSQGDLLVRAEDGKQAIFEPADGGGYQAPPGVRSSLTTAANGYRLTKLDRSYLTFDATGRLTGMKDHLGFGLDLSYVDGNLATITDAAGRVVTLTHTNGMLTQVALPDGRHVDYTYTDGYLTRATDMRAQSTDYAYDDDYKFLESAEDPNGHFLFRNTFDPENGRVVAQLDPRGNETTFAWNEATQTSTTVDPDGGEWVEVYANNLLVERRDPLGNSVKYGYDDKLNRISVIDGNNQSTTMTYDDAGNMLTRTAPAPLSYQEVWTYTGFNTVDTYRNGRLKVTDYDYNANQQLARITDPLNRETDFTYVQGQIDTITDPRDKVSDFGYDADGNRTSVLSPEGGLTTFTFDDSGRMESMTEPRGHVAGANAADYTTEYTYNNNDQPLTVTDALDHVTAYTYDNAGNVDTVTGADEKVTDFDFNADNQIDTVTDPRGGVTTTTYDDRGNVSSITTAAGTPDSSKTSFVYDAANRLESKVTPRGNDVGANPAPFTWTYTYDGNGNLKTESNPTAGTTVHTYDELNRRDSTKNALDEVTEFTYDANSNLTSVKDPLNRVTSYEFDAADQLDKVFDAYLKETDYGYDNSGNRTSVVTPLLLETRWTYDGDGRLATEVDPRGTQPGAVADDFTTTYSYDVAGHLKQVTDPLNHATKYDYDRVGNLVTRTDANTHATGYTYDAMNRLTTVTGPGNTGTTTYEYDDSGNLHKRIDAHDHDSVFDHDLSGRLRSKTTSIGTWGYEYDSAGNLRQTVTAAGNATPTAGDGTITRTYDPLDRLTAIDYSDSTPDVTYAYDEVRQESMSDGAGTEAYDFDAAGQLQTITRGTAVFDYDYDQLGRITKRTFPDGTIVNQTWDNDSRPRLLTSGTASVDVSEYDAAGNPTKTELGNGLTETRTYNRAGWLTDVATKRPTGIIVAQHSVTPDNVGNPLQVVRKYNLTTVSESYEYDAADRIKKACYTATCSQRIEYTYDELGNRQTENRVGGTGAGLVTSTYDPATDQLVQTSRPGGLLQPPLVTTYGYDDNGSLETVNYPTGSTTLSYDLENRLKSAVGTTTNSYTYDGNGLRRSVTTNGTTANYTWDPMNPVPELVTEAVGTATRKFLNDAAGDTVAVTNPGTGTGTGLHYLHLDGLGSVRAATDTGANVRGTYSYEPFGTARTSPTNQNGLTNPIGFAGEYKDVATGLYHLRARQLDTTTGRFTALDPVAQDISDPYVSEYVYANNRPTALTDPSGMCPWCVVGALISGALYAGQVLLTDEEFDLQKLAIETMAGGIGGLAGGLAWKAGGRLVSGRLGGMAQGSVSGVVGDTAYSLAAGHGLPSLEDVLLAAILGGASGCLLSKGVGGAAAEIRRNSAGQAIGPDGRYIVDPARVVTPTQGSVGGVHGNSRLSDKPTSLYRLYDLEGNYLKTGITSNPGGRYTQDFMSDKYMDIINVGTRSNMMDLERHIVLNDRGPLNLERWKP